MKTVKKDTQTGRWRRWFLLGPGSIIALIVGVGIAVAGRLADKPGPDPNAGHIVFEAGKDGRLQRVDSPSVPRIPIRRLWKPGPDLLIEHGSALKLSNVQRSQIGKLNAQWRTEKTALELDLCTAAQNASARVQADETGDAASQSQIVSGLAAYSQLSRSYEESRVDFWRRAAALLSAEQRNKLQQLAETYGRTHRP